MTKTDLYDLALTRYAEPALFSFTNGEGKEDCCLGYWMRTYEAEALGLLLIFVSGSRTAQVIGPRTSEDGTQGVVLVARASTWAEVARASGLVALEPVRRKTEPVPEAPATMKTLNGAG